MVRRLEPRRRDVTLAIRTNDIQPLSEAELDTATGGLVGSNLIPAGAALTNRLSEAFQAIHPPTPPRLPPIDW
jgi:hypothetical protein